MGGSVLVHLSLSYLISLYKVHNNIGTDMPWKNHTSILLSGHLRILITVIYDTVPGYMNNNTRVEESLNASIVPL
jgi:hypothetical protein